MQLVPWTTAWDSHVTNVYWHMQISLSQRLTCSKFTFSRTETVSCNPERHLIHNMQYRTSYINSQHLKTTWNLLKVTAKLTPYLWRICMIIALMASCERAIALVKSSQLYRYHDQQAVFKLPTAPGESGWAMVSPTDGHFQKFHVVFRCAHLGSYSISALAEGLIFLKKCLVLNKKLFTSAWSPTK